MGSMNRNITRIVRCRTLPENKSLTRWILPGNTNLRTWISAKIYEVGPFGEFKMLGVRSYQRTNMNEVELYEWA